MRYALKGQEGNGRSIKSRKGTWKATEVGTHLDSFLLPPQVSAWFYHFEILKSTVFQQN